MIVNKPLALFLLVFFSISSCKNEESKSEPIIPLKEGEACSTELLCRTWQLVEINGENIEGSNDDLVVLFSKSEAYYVDFKSVIGNDTGGLSQWKWDGGANTTLTYSWNEVKNWPHENVIEVIDISASQLRLRESHQGEVSEYRLVPIADKGAGHKTGRTSAVESRIQKGFFKR